MGMSPPVSLSKNRLRIGRQEGIFYKEGDDHEIKDNPHRLSG